MSVKSVTNVVLLCTYVTCFHYDKDCESKDVWATDDIQSSWNIRLWVSEGDHGVLTFFFENPQMSSMKRIEITRPQVYYWSKQKENLTSIAGDVMSPGWKEVRVTLDERLRVWVKGLNVTLVDEEGGIRPEWITIYGSNFTVNCEGNLTVWVASNGKEVFVPMKGAGRYDITVSSRTPFSPVLKFGHQMHHLSWDDKAKTITTFASQPTPLPPFIDHNFTLQCDSEINRFKCTAVAGPNNTLVADFSLPKGTESFSFKGQEEMEFLIGLWNTNKDGRREQMMISNGSNIHGTIYPLVITFLIICLIVMFVSNAKRYFKNKKLKESSVVREPNLELLRISQREDTEIPMEDTNASNEDPILRMNINNEMDADLQSYRDENL